ncbi:MAG: GAF domain-containing protein, partial [Chloroflexota bacterium]
MAAQVAIAVEDARMYVERQEQAWVATALLQVAETIGSLTSSQEVLSSIVRLTPILVGVDRCMLFLWEDDSGQYVSSESFGLSAESRVRFADLRLAPDQFPLLDQVRTAGEPILVRFGDEQGLIPVDVMKDYQIGVAFALPLRVKGEVVGVMLAEYSDPNAELSSANRSVLTGIANQAAMAVESARLYEARREEAWVSTALLQVSSSLENTTDLDEILERVVSLTTLLAGVDRCAILLFDEAAGEFMPAQVHGISRERLPEFLALRFAPGQMPLLDEIRDRRAPVSAEHGSDGASTSLRMMQEFGFSSLLGLPLLARGEIIGAMLVDRVKMPLGLSERQISVLMGIANQVSVAIENARLYQESLEKERMTRELQVARDIQISFLPKACPQVPGWQVCADWRSAREVGGDFYDFIWLDTNHLGLVIADVSDKGVPAALFMALSRTVMRASATDARSPVEALVRANELLTADTSSGMFVTLFYGILDITTGQLRYGRAGHNPPLHFDRVGGRVRSLDG